MDPLMMILAALFWIVAILGLAWLLTYLLAIPPAPPQIKAVIPGAVWWIAVLACVAVLILAIAGRLPFPLLILPLRGA